MPVDKGPAPLVPQKGSPKPKPAAPKAPSGGGPKAPPSSGSPSTGAPAVGDVSGDLDLATATDQQILDYITKNYGYLTWALEIPELKAVLINAHRNGWGELEVEAGIRATAWWKTTEPTIREYTRMQTEDPAKLQALIAERELDLQIAAAKAGIQIDDGRLRAMAEQAVKFGWNEQDTAKALAGEFKYNPERPLEGEIGDQYFDALALAKSYMVPISDKTAADWAMKIITGQATVGGYEAYLRNTAIGMFPDLKSYIDQGITPAQYFEPYAQTASKVLERPITVSDLFDTNLADTFQFYDEKTGKTRPMTLTEFNTKLRGLPEWAETGSAKEEVASIVNFIGTTFGKV